MLAERGSASDAVDAADRWLAEAGIAVSPRPAPTPPRTPQSARLPSRGESSAGRPDGLRKLDLEQVAAAPSEGVPPPAARVVVRGGRRRQRREQQLQAEEEEAMLSRARKLAMLDLDVDR